MSMMSQLILHLDTSENGIYYNGESICIAMCNIARLHAESVSVFLGGVFFGCFFGFFFKRNLLFGYITNMTWRYSLL